MYREQYSRPCCYVLKKPARIPHQPLWEEEAALDAETAPLLVAPLAPIHTYNSLGGCGLYCWWWGEEEGANLWGSSPKNEGGKENMRLLLLATASSSSSRRMSIMRKFSSEKRITNDRPLFPTPNFQWRWGDYLAKKGGGRAGPVIS